MQNKNRPGVAYVKVTHNKIGVVIGDFFRIYSFDLVV